MYTHMHDALLLFACMYVHSEIFLDVYMYMYICVIVDFHGPGQLAHAFHYPWSKLLPRGLYRGYVGSSLKEMLGFMPGVLTIAHMTSP